MVTNLLHQFTELNDIRRHVLHLCDGNRTRQQLLDSLVGLFSDGKLVVHLKEQPVTDDTLARPVLSESLDRSLIQLAKEGLMME